VPHNQGKLGLANIDKFRRWLGRAFIPGHYCRFEFGGSALFVDQTLHPKMPAGDMSKRYKQLKVYASVISVHSGGFFLRLLLGTIAPMIR
jgi:hypothetical protein